jgi:hypothetical protein
MNTNAKALTNNSLSAIVIACLLVIHPAQASWITAIGKAIKTGEGAATAAKTGAAGKGAAAAVIGSEIDDAARLSKIQSTPPGLPESSPNIFLQHPWQTIQLAKCISRLEPRFGNKEATSSCAAKYEKCAHTVEKQPNLNTPVESCVNAVNKE